MNISNIWFCTISTLIFEGCISQSTKELSTDNSDKKINRAENQKIIYLYAVDSAFLPYMPDTNNLFISSEARRNYFLLTMKRYQDFKNGYYPAGKTDDEIVLAKRDADIMFDDYMDLINFKFAKNGTKSKATMVLLSLYSPYSNLSSLRERLDLINCYPEEIKMSDIGKKTIEILGEYSNNKNIGLNFHNFSSINIIDTGSKKYFLKNIFVPEKKYQIIIFGASWCLPCRLEELQLKYWLPMIDSTLIRITYFSIDKSFDSWKKYIRSNNIKWPAFLVNGEMNNQMIKRLDFQGIPRNILLNEKGIILSENTDLRKILKEIPDIRTNSDYYYYKAKE